MKQHFHPARRQSGVMLIEALIALLIFSVGILGIVGMQSAAVQASGDAKYRSDAALLANQLIGRMWVSDRTQATLQTAYQTNGAAYQAWAWTGAGGTGTQTAPATGTVMQVLPGVTAAANLPTVVITPNPGSTPTSIPNNVVTITVFWQAPKDTTAHQFVAQAQISRNP
jgi:type IV pilus assembly protein PilV